ncbi:MAG: hypothetical protein A3F12_03530 [Gammaproteobacteria bacterium RIFCSPHIGHO2_12_FULL_38_14]|nr:MAG: hypothetical protein A3F12_03530 [Gammaproteobacteria bacterium RIFCSPHIGHO2_12_FULL_38_14]
MTHKIITWDLGATKCAVAVVDYDKHQNHLHCKQSGLIKIRDCISLDQLTQELENVLDMKMSHADAICIGAAGQYNGESLQLAAGYPYAMHFAALAKQYNWPVFSVIHDYSPIVCATFTNYFEEPSNIKRLNAVPLHPLGRRIALGIGTGIGLKDGILFENGDFWLGTNEFGHIGVVMPPSASKQTLERHNALLYFLREKYILKKDEGLSFEKLLAGQGMAHMHHFFYPDQKNKTIEEVGDLVRQKKAPETLAAYAWYVGLLVGTAQLSFMPDGGVWLTGGVVLNHLEIFEQDDFFLGIEASPAYLNLRQQFPLGILCGKDHAFMGGAYYASKRLLD